MKYYSKVSIASYCFIITTVEYRWTVWCIFPVIVELIIITFLLLTWTKKFSRLGDAYIFVMNYLYCCFLLLYSYYSEVLVEGVMYISCHCVVVAYYYSESWNLVDWLWWIYFWSLIIYLCFIVTTVKYFLFLITSQLFLTALLLLQWSIGELCDVYFPSLRSLLIININFFVTTVNQEIW